MKLVFALSMLLAGSAHSQPIGNAVCDPLCVTLEQVHGAESTPLAALECRKEWRLCFGKGSLRIGSKEIPVFIATAIEPMDLILFVRSADESFGARLSDHWRVRLERDAAQSIELEVYRAAKDAMHYRDRNWVPPVLRIGELLSVTLRVSVRRSAALSPVFPK